MSVSKFKVQQWIHTGCFKMIFEHPKNQDKKKSGFDAHKKINFDCTKLVNFCWKYLYIYIYIILVIIFFTKKKFIKIHHQKNH